MSCKRSQELLATAEIEIRELVRADKAPIPEAAALALVRQARRLIVAKGKQPTTIDVARERPDDATLRALVGGGLYAGATFTCVPPGSGARVGLDRDGDGWADGDELLRGRDPDDPTSHL